MGLPLMLELVDRSLRAIGVVDVEATTALGAKVATTNHLTDERAGTILRVAGLRVENVHDGKADVQPDEIAELKRTHRMIGTELHGGVNA